IFKLTQLLEIASCRPDCRIHWHAIAIFMQESIGHIIWSACYLSVLIGLSAYGIHRYFIIYLYLKNRKRPPVPARYFEKLPKVTVQLPIFIRKRTCSNALSISLPIQKSE